MPGLTINTDGTGIPQTPVPVPVPNIAGYTPAAPSAPPTPVTGVPSSSAASPAAATSAAAVNRVLPPHKVAAASNPPTPSRIAPTPAPAPPRAPAAHTVLTQAPGPNIGSSSPTRPPVSPITPPLNPVSFPPPRQSHAHSSHPQQTVVAPPPPEPIEFDSNPDVLALKSAISVLQMQSAKAKRDMIALQKAKTAALADPQAFVTDLTSGNLCMEGDEPRDQSSSSSSDEEEDKDDDCLAGRDSRPSSIKTEPRGTMAFDGPSREPKAWSRLPAAQNIYRCPPINWSQYAVAGDSLDKLHREQQRRPAQGVPATMTPDGRYEFKGVGKQEEFVGVAAPYNPLKDSLDKTKPKGPN